MSLARTLVLKEWSLHRDVVRDAVVFAVCGSLIAPWPTVACLLVFCGLAAARVGARLGQDLRQFDTLEFMLTRPIDRRSFVRQRLLFGALPVVLALVLVAVIGGFGLRSVALDAFAGAAPWLEREPSTATSASSIAFAVAIVALVYVCAFERGLKATALDSPSSIASEGALRAGGVVLTVWMLLNVAPNVIGLVLRSAPPVGSASESEIAFTTEIGPLAVLAVVLAGAWGIRRSERVVALYDAGGPAKGPATSRRAEWIVATLVLVLVGGLVVAWLLPVATSPRVVPAGASPMGGK